MDTLESKKFQPTELDEKVYEAIQRATEYGCGGISQRDLCEAVGLKYRPHNLVIGGIKHSDGCRALWNVIQHINSCPKFDKIVVCDKGKYYYHLATKEDAEAEIRQLKSDIGKKSKRAKFIAQKYGLKGQYDLLDGVFQNPFFSDEGCKKEDESEPNKETEAKQG